MQQQQPLGFAARVFAPWMQEVRGHPRELQGKGVHAKGSLERRCCVPGMLPRAAGTVVPVAVLQGAGCAPRALAHLPFSS